MAIERTRISVIPVTQIEQSRLTSPSSLQEFLFPDHSGVDLVSLLAKIEPFLSKRKIF